MNGVNGEADGCERCNHSGYVAVRPEAVSAELLSILVDNGARVRATRPAVVRGKLSDGARVASSKSTPALSSRERSNAGLVKAREVRAAKAAARKASAQRTAAVATATAEAHRTGRPVDAKLGAKPVPVAAAKVAPVLDPVVKVPGRMSKDERKAANRALWVEVNRDANDPRWINRPWLAKGR